MAFALPPHLARPGQMWKARASSRPRGTHGTVVGASHSHSLLVREKLACIVLLFVVIVASLLFLVNVHLELLSAVRGYVAGEGLWSKGQKVAVQTLALYADSGDERHYTRYLAAMTAPLGDREARLELLKEHPDVAKAT